MSEEDIEYLSRAGIDIQLHTHRHHFPVEKITALRELEENAEVLSSCVEGELVHFCYPSGIWDREQFSWLEEAGIISATTCNIGFNDVSTCRYELKRYLDRADISEIEFLAEISGVMSG